MKTQSTTKGFAILSAAGMMVKILSLLYIPLLIIIIGEEGYGIYSAAYQVYAFVYVITNSGIPVAISKQVSEFTALKNYKDSVRTFKIARNMLLILGTVMTIFMMIFAMPLAKSTHYPKAYLAILYLSPTILFTSVASAYRGYFQGRGDMKPTAVSQILEQIMNTIFTLLFAYLLLKKGIPLLHIKSGVEAGCAGGTIGTSLGALASGLFLMGVYEKRKNISMDYDLKNSQGKRTSGRVLIRRVLNYSLPITACVGLQYAGNLIDLANTKSRLLVAGFSDSRATILYGTLVKYQQLLNVPIAIISALSAAILPAIAGAVAVKNKSDVKKGINYALKTCFLVSIPAAVGLAVLNYPIFNMLFSKRYSGGASLMKIGSVVLVLMSVVQIQTTILQSIGKLYVSTLYLMIGIAAKIGINYILIANPSININGAIFGSIVCFAIPLFLNHMNIKKYLDIDFKLFKHAIKPLLSSLLMGIVAYLVWYDANFLLGYIISDYFSNAAATAIAIICGGYVYLLGLITTGGIRKSDLSSLPAKMVRLIPKTLITKVR